MNLVGELAKIIKQNGVNIGQRRLFKWLRQNGFLIKRQGVDYNMPTQYSMERELFEIKETSITHSDGHTSISKTPKVTGKGQQYFVNKFLGENKHLKRRNNKCYKNLESRKKKIN
ncbi:oxidoreductase [Staphylococcus lugdunensis]|nr:oxidoreductase [Staphylococcus lugdunensis]